MYLKPNPLNLHPLWKLKQGLTEWRMENGEWRKGLYLGTLPMYFYSKCWSGKTAGGFCGFCGLDWVGFGYICPCSHGAIHPT